MCGRYTITDPAKIAKRFSVKVSEPVKPSFNVAPGQFMPVIKEDGVTKQTGIDIMKWGLIPYWAKDETIGYRLFNARSETVFEKPAWRSAIARRRCLVPATGFYEWKHEGKEKQPYYITLKKSSMFAFAGIWEAWHDSAGNEIHSYSILTTTPNKEMTRLHDRMPVILHEDDETLWLHEDDHGFLEHVMRPYDDGALQLAEVSKDVNVAKSNDGHLILPLNPK